MNLANFLCHLKRNLKYIINFSSKSCTWDLSVFRMTPRLKFSVPKIKGLQLSIEYLRFMRDEL